MLVEFTVENFRSFRDRVTLSMVATADKSLSDNIVVRKEKERYLRTAAVYGANASGKSNLVAAIQFMRNFVLNSRQQQKGFKILYQPFKMDASKSGQPSVFEVVFLREGIRYQYGFSHNSEKVINEYLYAYPKGRRALVFDRKDGVFKYTRDKGRQKFIEEQTLENALYLSTATQLNYEPTSNAFGWFKDCLTVGMGSYSGPRRTVHMILDEPSQKEIIMRALSVADVGIAEVSPERKMSRLEDAPVPEQIKKMFDGQGDGEVESISYKTVHKALVNGETANVYFDSTEESDGTKRLFEMIGPWADAITNGRVLVWDELDLRLHHMLAVFLINLFQDPSQSKNDAQLIFTTHNTNLLDSDRFRRDQIWFTERDAESGNSVLYSLVEFKPRKDKNLRIGYLSGRYGALPFIGSEKVIE